MYLFFIALVLKVCAAHPGTATLTAATKSDFILRGTQVWRDGEMILRSGNPGKSDTSAVFPTVVVLTPGTLVESLSFTYRYVTGYGPAGSGVGANFTVRIAGKPVYASPHLKDFAYEENRTNYSTPVTVNVSDVNITIPSASTTRIEIQFQNNDRNLQLLLPLKFKLKCSSVSTSDECTTPYSPPVPPAPPPPPQTATMLFRSGDADDQNRTWHCVRGPGLVRSPNGTLLVFFGGTPDCGDGSFGLHGWLMRASIDNGTTWSPTRAIFTHTNVHGGYAAPLVDMKRGVVLYMYQVNFSQTWIMRSTDDGMTWDAPGTNVTDAFGGSQQAQIGPPGGVQLPSGRLVQSAHGGNNASAAAGFALISDDGGTSWRQGLGVPFNGSEVVSGGESQLVDHPKRGPHSLALFIRVSSRNADLNHAISFSDDEGDSWSTPLLVPNVTGPTCQGSVARLTDGRLLMSAPNNFHWRYPADRKDLTVWVLMPNVTSNLPMLEQEVRIWKGPAAYSSLLSDGEFVAFEGSETYRYGGIMFAKVNVSHSVDLATTSSATTIYI